MGFSTLFLFARNKTELSALCRKMNVSQIPEGNVCL